MSTRFDELYIPLQFLSHDILVCCPSCLNKGVIKLEREGLHGEHLFLQDVWNDLGFIGSSFTTDYDNPSPKFICLSCGKQQKGQCSGVFRQPSEPKDPYFGYSLYLKKDLAQGTIWVYNLKHLELLYKYIEASSRVKAFTYNCGYLKSAQDKIEHELDDLYGQLTYDKRNKARREHLDKYAGTFPLDRANRHEFSHSFSENLPKWIKLAKHRKIVLAALDDLRHRA